MVIGNIFARKINVSAQNGVSIGVALAYNLPTAVYKGVAVLRGGYRVHHNAKVAACGIFHAHGYIESAGGKPVLLVFNRARAYCNIGKQVG